MRIFISILLFQISFFSLALEVESNTLTIKTSVDEGKTYDIKSVTKTVLSPEEGSIITIEAVTGEKCIIPLEKVIQIPIAKRQVCAGCIKSHAELESYYTQFFLNGYKPNISCDVVDGETVGFHFLGATEVDGKSSFNSKGMVFDIAQYSSGPFFKPEEVPNAFEEVLDDVADVLLRYAF